MYVTVAYCDVTTNTRSCLPYMLSRKCWSVCRYKVQLHWRPPTENMEDSIKRLKLLVVEHPNTNEYTILTFLCFLYTIFSNLTKTGALLQAPFPHFPSSSTVLATHLTHAPPVVFLASRTVASALLMQHWLTGTTNSPIIHPTPTIHHFHPFRASHSSSRSIIPRGNPPLNQFSIPFIYPI